MGVVSSVEERLTRWLWVAESDLDTVVVAVVGEAAADRAEELWATLEGALDVAVGRLVVADLSGVTAFDSDTVQALVTVARGAARRHDDLCFVVRENSSLARCAQSYGLGTLRSVYSSVMSAVVGSALPVGG